MDLDAAREFVRQHHRGVLVTRRADGSPQTSPVMAGLDELGNVAISSREPAYKVRNLRRDPQASYCGFTDHFFGDWVQIDGTAEIVSLPEAMESLVDLYRSMAGEHPDWDDYRAAMDRERRVVIRITPEHAGPDRSG
jgi:PPOX class probable F420-dependent enzyme